MTAEQKREIIVRLKEYKDENEISIERACNMVLDAGFSTSITTAKRIFAKDSELDAGSFRYETLRPYYVVFYGTESPTPKREPGNEEQARQYYTELEGVKAILAIKNEQLERREHELKDLRQRNAETKQDAQTKIDYLKKAIEKADAEHKRAEDRMDNTIRILRRALVIVSVLLAIFVITTTFVLSYDLLNRDIGWFRDLASHMSASARVL